MASITFVRGPHAGTELQLPDAAISLGRDDTAGFPLNDDSVSRHHAEIRRTATGWLITDLGSANGTLVNGQECGQRLLVQGDTVEIGESQFEFNTEEAPGEPFQDAPPPLPVPVPESLPAPPPPVRETAPPVRAAPAAVHATDERDLELVRAMRTRTDRIRQELGKVIVGQTDVINQILMCMVANGHALLIGLPGMAKTLTVRTLAAVLNLEYKRVQFTPDLMPSDIIGTDVLETNQSTGDKEFRFIRGPVFCNLLLADEINRTPPKTQAALLEAMQEKCVTAGNTTYHLDEPFFVLATQNPIEQEGTYPLPEAQLDRFMFNIWVDYPEEHEEEQIVSATTGGTKAHVEPVMTKTEILQIQDVARKVPVSDHVIKYAIRLVRATRPSNPSAPEITRTYVSTGAGPRAGQYLVLAAKARAILEGRIHVSCRDIRLAAIPVLRHRILTNFAADSEGKTPLSLIEDLITLIEEPSGKDYTR